MSAMTASRGGPRRRERGLTLLELLVAVAIMGLGTVTLLAIRTAAVDKAGKTSRQRVMQRLAQEKLDEIVFGVEENFSGDFHDQGRSSWTWETDEQIQQIGDEILIQRTIVVTARPEGELIDFETDHEQGGETYQLSCWCHPDAHWYEINADLFDEEGRYVPEYEAELPISY